MVGFRQQIQQKYMCAETDRINHTLFCATVQSLRNVLERARFLGIFIHPSSAPCSKKKEEHHKL